MTLPTDLPSMILGIILAAATLVGGGIARGASRDIYVWLKAKIWPPPPAPIEVPSSYVHRNIAEVSSWVIEPKVLDYEAKGYTKVLHPKTGGPCFMRNVDHRGETRQFLMEKRGEDPQR